MSHSLPDDAIDGVPLAVGIHCLLEQGHSVLFDEYINYMLQYLRSLVCYREVCGTTHKSILEHNYQRCREEKASIADVRK